MIKNITMTSAHFVYIPVIFLLGLFTGTLLSIKQDTSRESRRGSYRVSGELLISSFVLFGFVFVGTHVLHISRSPHAVKMALNGAELFDRTPSYTSTEVYDRIASFTPAGIALYKQFTYTTDVVFPLTLLMFLTLLVWFTAERAAVKKRFRFLLISIPITWFVVDITENTIIYRLLDLLPSKNETLAGLLGYITTTKFALLILSIIAAVVVKITGRKLIKPEAGG